MGRAYKHLTGEPNCGPCLQAIGGLNNGPRLQAIRSLNSCLCFQVSFWRSTSRRYLVSYEGTRWHHESSCGKLQSQIKFVL